MNARAPLTHGRAVDRLAELEEERRFLLRSLDDLDREHDAGDVDDEDYVTLRDGYTARAAAVIREIDAGRAALPARRPVHAGRVAAITVTIVAIAALAGWLVARSSGQEVPEAVAVRSPADEVAQLLAEARQLGPLDALVTYGDVLQLDPGNVEALTYSGWTARLVALQAPEGSSRDELVAAAEAKLREAIAIDPAYPDARCFLAVLLFRDRADAAGARTALDACEAAGPPAIVADLVAALGDEIDAALPA